MRIPVDVTLKDESSDSLNVLQPDLLVSCDYNDKRTKSDRYEGNPALVIEIMSMQTRAKDMVEKPNIYMTGGVIEYWIIDPRDKRVIVYLFKERQPEDICVFTTKDIIAYYTFPQIHIKAGDIFSDI